MEVTRIVFADRKSVEIQAVDTDLKLEPKQMLVKTARSMVSQGTELAALMGTHSKSEAADPPAWLQFPSVPGYLAVGEVMETGSEVHGFSVGDRVIAEGSGCWNSHASHITVWESVWVTKLPEGVPYEAAVMSKLASVGMYGLRILHHELGENVAVFGLGVVGQLAVRFCSIAGFRQIVAVDPMANRRRVAEGVPGVTVVAPDDPLVNEEMGARSEKEGYDNVIEASGHPRGFMQALNVARTRGRVSVPSAPHEYVQVRLYDEVMYKSLQIFGARGSSQPGTPTYNDGWSEPRQKEWFLQLVAEGRIEVAPIVSHHVSYAEAPSIYTGLMERPEDYLGVVFNWD